MSEREKTIKMIMDISGCLRYYAELIVDKLFKEGLIIPPVKIGDSLWDVYYGKPREWNVSYIGYNGEDFDISVRFKNGARYRTKLISGRYIGRVFYLTREDAVKAIMI